jgi:long-chain acyl-CoA synthetase
MYKPDYTSLFSYLSKSSRTWSDNEAFVIRRRVKKEIIRYGEIPLLLRLVDGFLKKKRISKNAYVLFWGLNCPEYAIALLSCMCFGKVAIPIDWRTSTETIEHIIKKTKPNIAFISKYFQHKFLLDQGIQVFFIEDLLSEILHVSASSRPHQSNKNPNRVVEIVFTSGTTGTPKGVVMKQKNILANLKSVESCLPDLTGSRTVSVLPLSHMLEQIAGLLLPIGYGTTIYYVSRINSFRLLQAFAQYKPTHLIFVPQLIKIFWDKIEDRANITGSLGTLTKLMKIAPYIPQSVKKMIFSRIHAVFGGSLQFIACGGAPLDALIGKNWQSIGIPIIEGYGATEATAIAVVNSVQNPKLGFVGKPIAGVTIRLDSEGEIYIQSDSLSAGYFNDKEKTKAVFTKKGYKTGDIGTFDKDGNLRIIGRDVFKIVLQSGEKVYAEDVESTILQDHRVKEACVVAKRTGAGDTVHACIICKKDAHNSLKKIVADINLRLESKQQFTSFEAWPNDDFPRTPTLKIDRKFVSEVVNNRIDSSVVSGTKSDSAFSIQSITDVLSKVSGIEATRIQDGDTLAGDLNIDSLTRVEVVALAEEHLGILLDEGKITAKTTVQEMKYMAKTSEAIEEVFLPTWQFTTLGLFLHYISIKYFLAPLHSLVISIHYPQKRVPHITPGSILIFNHPGILDGVCVIRALLDQKQYAVVTNSGANFWSEHTPFAKPLELFVGGIPLYESGQAFLKVLQTDSDLLAKGYMLLFAPQGGLQTTPEEKPFKPGIGYIIQQLDCPVHILKIEGYYDIWPVPNKGFSHCSFMDFFPHKKGTVDVKVSPAIMSDWQSMTPIQITNLLEEKFRDL